MRTRNSQIALPSLHRQSIPFSISTSIPFFNLGISVARVTKLPYNSIQVHEAYRRLPCSENYHAFNLHSYTYIVCYTVYQNFAEAIPIRFHSSYHQRGGR